MLDQMHCLSKIAWNGNQLCDNLQDLVTAILDIMGLSAGSVNDSDSLAGMGIDSMQLVEVSHFHLCLLRPTYMLTRVHSSFPEVSARSVLRFQSDHDKT